MKTPKLTKAGTAFKQALQRCFQHALAAARSHLARGYRLRYKHKTIVICIKRSSDGSESGGGYVIPRGGNLAITRADRELIFNASRRYETMRVPFGSDTDAADAMHRIQKRMLSNRPLVWTGRVVLLGITWLLFSSYLQVHARQQAAAEQVVASNSGSALAPLPGAQSDLTAFPGASSPDSAPLPVGSSEPDPVLASPAAPAPASSASPAGGLDSFGLDSTSASTPASAPPASVPGAEQAGVSGTTTKGPGCDPALAFKAPAR